MKQLEHTYVTVKHMYALVCVETYVSTQTVAERCKIYA